MCMANIAIIGRTEILYNTALNILNSGHQVSLIVTAKEAAEYKKTSSDFEQLAQKINATYIYTAKINTPDSISKIKKLPPIDMAVSVNYPGIISQEVIKLFNLGVLNAHGGDLPRYRGNACQAWAMINKEDKIGLCVHKMIGGELDAGDIITRKYYPINMNTRIGQVYAWMEKESPALFLEALKKLEKNPKYVLEKQSKNKQDALRCYPRSPEDGEIDWGNSNEDILRLINASSEPFAGAFCKYQGEKMVIWRAQIYQDDEIYLAVPGQITSLNRDDGSVVVATDQGKLLIQEIEFRDQRTSPFTFIKSIRKRLK